MEKYDVFFIVLYGSFFAVMVTFIINFDGTNGFGGTNKITSIIKGENSQSFQKPGRDKDNRHDRKVNKPLSLTKWDSGEGDEKYSKAGV